MDEYKLSYLSCKKQQSPSSITAPVSKSTASLKQKLSSLFAKLIIIREGQKKMELLIFPHFQST